MKNEKRRVLIGEIMDNETKKIRPIGFFPEEDERNFDCAGPQQRPLLSKHVRKTKPSFVWFVARRSTKKNCEK